MKRIPLLILLAVGILVMLQQTFAQQAKTKPAVKVSEKPAPTIPEVDATLGRSNLNGGSISKYVFDSLVKQGVHVTNGGTIKGFNFTYAEHTMYEDSAGNPLRVTDYLSEHCLGDTLTPGISYSIFERTKPGDTAYFDQIKVVLPSGADAHGKPMKFLIVGSRGN